KQLVVLGYAKRLFAHGVAHLDRRLRLLQQPAQEIALAGLRARPGPGSPDGAAGPSSGRTRPKISISITSPGQIMPEHQPLPTGPAVPLLGEIRLERLRQRRPGYTEP